MKQKSNKSANSKRVQKMEYTKEELELLNSEGCDKKIREKVIKLTRKHDINITLFEPGVFDLGIKRIGRKRDGYVAVYDVMKLAEALANDYMRWNSSQENKHKIEDYDFDAAFSDAIEWIDYNTVRTLPYIMSGRPKLVIDNENGRETSYT